MERQTVVPFPSSRHGNSIDIFDARDIKRHIPAIATIDQGVLHIFIRGSGAGLSVNENCDPTVRSDMTEALLRLLPSRPSQSDADSARALLMSQSLALPISNGSLSMGTWQGVYFGRHHPAAYGDIIFTVLQADAQAGFTFNADQRQSHSITKEVNEVLQTRRPCDKKRNVGGVARSTETLASSTAIGTILVHEKHTSASLSLAGADLEPAMRKVIPETWNEEFFQHTYEGPDDMPGHMKSTLLGCSVVVPLIDGSASLGSDQSLMLNEHRDVGGFGVGHQRKVQVTSMPAAVQHVVHVPPCSFADGALVIEITSEIQKVAALVKTGPGLVHIFAAGPLHSVLIAEKAAASTFATSLNSLTNDERARAAIGKNGPCVPFGSNGELLLGEQQRIWLYNACDRKEETEVADVLPIVITVHTAQGNSLL